MNGCSAEKVGFSHAWKKTRERENMEEGGKKAINHFRGEFVSQLLLLLSVLVGVCLLVPFVRPANLCLSLRVSSCQCPRKAGLLFPPSLPLSFPSPSSRSSLLSLLCIFFSWSGEGGKEGERKGGRQEAPYIYWRVCMYRDRVFLLVWVWQLAVAADTPSSHSSHSPCSSSVRSSSVLAPPLFLVFSLFSFPSPSSLLIYLPTYVCS